MEGNFAEKVKQLKALKNGRGISYVLNEGYKILGNPIVMFDTSYNLLAYIEGIATDDRLWNEITMQGTFSADTVDFFNAEYFIEDCALSDVVALLKSDKLKYDRVNGKIFDIDGVQLANICVMACMKPFEQQDMELIEIFCDTLSIEIQNSEFYQKIDRVYQETLSSSLIDGTGEKRQIFTEKRAELYDKFKANLYLAVIDITQYENTLTHLAYFRDLFKKMQPEYEYYIYLTNIVAIISTDDSRLSVKRDLDQLNEFFISHRIYAGISSGFQDLTELPKYFREAISALNYGLKSKRKQHIFRYDDMRIEHFLSTTKNGGSINGIYNPVIFMIQEYDRENGTSLLELLYTYLLYGKDAGQTCEHLGITKDRLDSQLKQLSDIFEIEWENGDMIINLFLSIRLLDCLQENENHQNAPS